MRLVIIGGSDNSVYVDGESRGGLDLSSCGLPENFWAFQWNEKGDNKGHIEFSSALVPNQEITEIPTWANACILVLQARIASDAEQAAAEAAASAAAAAQDAPQA